VRKHIFHHCESDLFIRSSYIGYIDLSKRRVSPEDITKCEERFMKARTVASIMRHVASRLPSYDPDASGSSADALSKAKKDQDKEGGGGDDEVVPPVGQSEEERLEKLYEQVAWILGRKYGNVYDAFKLALT